jgi:hypothetical protein
MFVEELSIACASGASWQLANKMNSDAKRNHCAQLEAELTKERRWRKDANERIRTMVSRATSLQQDCKRLYRANLRQEKDHQGQPKQALLEALQQAQRKSELLESRASSVRELGEELSTSLQRERAQHQQVAAHHGKAMSSARGQVEHLRRLVAASAVAEEQAINASRREFDRIWDQNRKQVAEEHDELLHEIRTAEQEITAAQCSKVAATQAAISEKACRLINLRCHLQHEETSEYEEIRRNVVSDFDFCEQMAAKLDDRLAETQGLQAALTKTMHKAGKRVLSPSTRHAIKLERSSASVRGAWLFVAQPYSEHVQVVSS